MANENPDAPFGFQALETEGKQNRVRVYAKNTGAALYQGDVVKLGSDGAVIVAAAGDRMIGVCAEYVAAAGTSIAVYDDPEAVFMVECDDTFALADVGQNANITATAGDSTLKISRQDLDVASFGTGATLQFKIIGLTSRGFNVVGQYAIVSVKPNNHEFKIGTSGV